MARLTRTLMLFILPLLAAAENFVCKDMPSAYPYCVHNLAKNKNRKMPLAISLPGSGARGDFSQAPDLCQYDAMGKQISNFNLGKGTANDKIAAEQFITVVPIASLATNERHFDPDKVLAVLKDVQKSYKVDNDRIYVVGYSMGGRGTCRFSVFHTEVLAAAAASAGPCESDGDAAMQQQPAPATFPLLKNIRNLPYREFAGLADETAGHTNAEKDRDQLAKLGGKKYKLTEFAGATHSDMTLKPFEETDVLSWLLKQKRVSKKTKKPSKKVASSAALSAAVTPASASASAPAASSPASKKRCRRDLEADEDIEQPSIPERSLYVRKTPLYWGGVAAPAQPVKRHQDRMHKRQKPHRH